jgi:hypothetical protein
MVSRGQFLSPRGDYGTYLVWPPFDYATILLLWLGIFAVFGLAKFIIPVRVRVLSRDLLSYWLLSLTAAFSLFKFVHVFYFIAFAGVISILSAIGIHAAFVNFKSASVKFLHPRRIFPMILFGVIMVSAATASFSMYGSNVQERDVTQAQASRIGDYIRQRTTPTDEIFTGNLIYAVDSGRKNALDISDPWIYLHGLEDPFPGNPFGSAPSISQISVHLASGSVRYVILDGQLLNIMAQHATLQSSVQSLFTLETTMYGVPIYRFSG